MSTHCGVSAMTQHRARDRGSPGVVSFVLCLAALAAGILLLAFAVPCGAITVISQSANTDIILGLSFAELEFQNPLSGTETVQGYSLAEWRDADYSPGPPPTYGDWIVSNPGVIDGNPNEIWLRTQGHSAGTSTTVASDVVSIHLTGDTNDGLAQVLVDGVEVARLDMYSASPHRALVIVKNLAWAAHKITVNDLGMGPSGQGDDVHIFGAGVLRRPGAVKWNQPPVPAHPQNVWYGWNEASVYGGPQIVADDWVCPNEDPVSDVHWWGSYLGWNGSDIPADAPTQFHLTIWSDVPAGQDATFSHPGKVVWEADVTKFTQDFAGWDFDPIQGKYEACFKYSVDLDPTNWFTQPPDTQPRIYWVSIAAEYPAGTVPSHLWGWKTRPRDPESKAPDDAVVIWGPVSPHVGDVYQGGGPLFFPTPDKSWDMAFELTSKKLTTVVKWDQPPLREPSGTGDYYGWDDTSMYRGETIVADDWVCTTALPVSDIHWWGSYPYYAEPVPPVIGGVQTFHIGVWTDVAAGSTGAFSHPGVLLKEWWVTRGQFSETFDGYDSYPGRPRDSCFRYDLILPPDQWFYQTPLDGRTVYWLSIAAVVDPAGPTIRQWGWKTRLRDATSPAPDDAVRIFVPNAPEVGAQYLQGMPIEQPVGVSWDTAFRLTSIVATEGYVKWSQPPVAYDPPDALLGWNEPSIYNGPQIVGDDWVCLGPKPVTDVHWWGSFLNWGERQPPKMPDAFHLAIWTNDPGTAGQFPFSHPAQCVWATVCRDFTWKFVGWDFDPRNEMTPPEACFEFNQLLPQELWYFQKGPEQIFWLTVSAIYETTTPGNNPWGWKTRPRRDSLAPDDAVVVLNPTAPVPGSIFRAGNPLFWPAPADSWDTAFRLTTVPVGSLTFKPNIPIRRHFWRPMPVARPANEMLSMWVTADATEAVRLTTLTLQAGGTGNDALDIQTVQVYVDTNNNGVVDAPDVLVGSGAYPGDNGAVNINIGPPAVIVPAGGQVSMLIAYVMNPVIMVAPGKTYFFQVVAASGTGLMSNMAVPVNGLPLMSSTKVRAKGPLKIGEAKLLKPESEVFLEGKVVTAAFAQPRTMFYIEEEDRSSGIGVVPSATELESPVIGDIVSVLGTTAYFSEEKTELVIDLEDMEMVGETVPLVSLRMNNRMTGGGAFGSQPGVMDDVTRDPRLPSYGLNNVGSLITTWGRVTGYMTQGDFQFMWINDGTDLHDGVTQAPGIMVLIPAGYTPPPEDTMVYLSVTGILWAVPAGPSPADVYGIRLLVPRNAGDIVQYVPDILPAQ